jgi:hypothetical protein
METECLLSLIEVTWAVPLLFSEIGLWDVRALQLFYNWVPSYIVAVPWFAAGGSSLAGVWLFLAADLAELPRPPSKISIILRRVGATLSLIIWAWMAFSSYLVLGAAAPVSSLYAWFGVAFLRTMWSAWSVQWTSRT